MIHTRMGAVVLMFMMLIVSAQGSCYTKCVQFCGTLTCAVGCILRCLEPGRSLSTTFAPASPPNPILDVNAFGSNHANQNDE
ncbi:hypothetical protein OROMI_026114 [Orobanche minor]